MKNPLLQNPINLYNLGIQCHSRSHLKWYALANKTKEETNPHERQKILLSKQDLLRTTCHRDLRRMKMLCQVMTLLLRLSQKLNKGRNEYVKTSQFWKINRHSKEKKRLEAF